MVGSYDWKYMTLLTDVMNSLQADVSSTVTKLHSKEHRLQVSMDLVSKERHHVPEERESRYTGTNC